MRTYGYVGAPGAYGEEALLTHYRGTVEPVPYPSPLEIVHAIQADQLDGGILSVKHTTTGTVQEVVDLLAITELAPCEKFSVSVQHCLLALSSQTIRDLRQVHAQPWALEQCAGFLRDLGIEQISECDAATYARRIGQEQLAQVGVVASARAASLYHLEVVAEDIQADDENLTRYVLLRPSPVLFSIGSPRITRVLGPGDSPAMEGPPMTLLAEQAALAQAQLLEAHAGNGWHALPPQTASNEGAGGAALALLEAGTEPSLVSSDGQNTEESPQAPGIPAALVLEDVCRVYGKRKKRQLAVDHLTLEVQQGEIFGLLGPNGAGKTTTINLLCGLLRPSSGSIYVLGLNISRRREARQMRARLGVVSQETALYGELTAQQNLAFQAGLYGLSRTRRQERIQAVLELTGLLAVKDKRVSRYSGGMKRRLAIARALIPDPDLLILDEPTLGVDVQSKMAIWSHIKALRSQGKTVLLTTNTLEEAQALSDRIAILDHGKLLVMDTLERLSAQYGGDGVLDVETAHVSRQVERLRAVPGVTAVSQQGIHLLLRARGMDDQLIAQVLTLLAQEGEVLRFSVQKPTLDEIFLELTGAALRD